MDINTALKKLLLIESIALLSLTCFGIVRWFATGIFMGWLVLPFMGIAIITFSIYRFAKL